MSNKTIPSRDVFLSHSSGPDNICSQRVVQISEALEALQPRKTTWIDRTNSPYALARNAEIRAAVESCNCFFLFLTQEYQEKVFNPNIPYNWCRYEYEVAMDLNKPILIILMEAGLSDPKTSWHPDLRVHHGRKLSFDMSDAAIYANADLLRQKCSLLGKILDNLQTNDISAAVHAILQSDDYCQEHGELCLYYDNHCHRVICQRCAITSHEGHSKVTMEEKAQEIRSKDFGDFIYQLNQTIKQGEEALSSILTVRQGSASIKDEAIQKIRSHCNSLRDQITTMENEVIACIESEHAKKDNPIKEVQIKVEMAKKETEERLNQFDLSAATGANVRLVKSWMKIKQENKRIITTFPTPYYDFSLFTVEKVTIPPFPFPSILINIDALTRPAKRWVVLWSSHVIQLDEIELTVTPTPLLINPPRINIALPVSYSCSFEILMPQLSSAERCIFNYNYGCITLHLSRYYASEQPARYDNCFRVTHLTTTPSPSSSSPTTSDGNYGLKCVVSNLLPTQYYRLCWTVSNGVMKIYFAGKLMCEQRGAYTWGEKSTGNTPPSWSWDLSTTTLLDSIYDYFFQSDVIKVRNVCWWDRELSDVEVRYL